MNNREDFELLTFLYTRTKEELRLYLRDFLRKVYGEKRVLSNRNYIIASGNIPICLVAHMDTVFSEKYIREKEIYYDSVQNVIWSPQGGGADDRAGVFAIIKILQRGYKPHLV